MEFLWYIPNQVTAGHRLDDTVAGHNSLPRLTALARLTEAHGWGCTRGTPSSAFLCDLYCVTRDSTLGSTPRPPTPTWRYLRTWWTGMGTVHDRGVLRYPREKRSAAGLKES